MLDLSLVVAAIAAFPVDSPLVGPQVQALRLPRPIVVDGIVDADEWQGAVRAGRFVQREPTEGAVPTESTVVYVAYDAGAIYVGARLFDSTPDSILARLGRRDADLLADEFTFYVDPYYDRRSGYFFTVNAAGTLSDGVLYNDDWDDNTWDGVWEGRARVDSLGWSVELRVPYSQLRFRQGEPQVWGVNFSRVVARKNELSYLVLRPRTESGFVSRFADLTGIAGIRPAAQVEVRPYVTAKAHYGPAAAGDPFYDGSAYGSTVGGDLRAGLGAGLTLNATVNPDFGQVEVDPAVVNLSDVETFFDEKRPFFVEGSSLFQFGFGGATNYFGFNWAGPDFFYTRRIGRAPQGALPDAEYADVPEGTRILGAGKVTGKVAGNWNVAMLSAITARETARLSLDGQTSAHEVEPLTYYGVGRMQKEFPEGRHGLGMIATLASRAFDDPALRDQLNSSSTAAGLDGWTFLDRDKEWVVTGWVGASQIRGTTARITSVQQDPRHYLQRPDATNLGVDSTAASLTGWAARVYLNKQRGDVYANVALGALSPTFDVHDLGFMFRTGFTNGHAAVGRMWNQPSGPFRRRELGGAVYGTRNWDGDITWLGVSTWGWGQFRNFSSANYFVSLNPRTVSDRRTRGGPLTLTPPGAEMYLNVRSDSRKAWSWGLNGGMYYRNAADRNASLGASVSFRPAPNVSLSFRPSVFVNRTPTQYIGAYDDSTATATYTQRYVFASLQQMEFSGGLRVDWTFTPTMSLQLYAQPLVSSGNYGYFRGLRAPRTADYDVYDSDDTYDAATETIYPNGRAAGDSIVLYNPDFSAVSLRGNAVLRWEYLPGSTLYLVWTQSRAAWEETGDLNFGQSMRQLMRTPAENIFLVKLSYYWTP